MWGATLIFFCSVAVQVTSHEIKEKCFKWNEFPQSSDTSPSLLADLRVELVTVGGKDMMNISWAINIDASNRYLKATHIILGEPRYRCEYKPAFSEADLTGLKQKWFHYLVKASYGLNSIQVANLPMPSLNEPIYKEVSLRIRRPTQTVKPKATTVPTVKETSLNTRIEAAHGDVTFTRITMAIFGGLAGLMILSSCYIIYRSCGANIATSLGFKRLPTAPVPVLMVYPAEDSAFQQAVLALAEFLQWYGGCSVAVDMWQQRKIAELGPIRWLAEKAKSAHRVLIVCPQPSSQVRHSAPNHTSPEPSIPAAAHDLYPLILNMVASHAKSASDLAKFWVVQLGEQQDKKPSHLAPELRACKTFCLMKDLKKLCSGLHAQSQDDKKISNLIFRPGMVYTEKCAVKLRKAVEKLGGHEPGIFREIEPLKSVVATA